MKRFAVVALLISMSVMPLAHAEEMPRPDDRVVFDIAAEDWVTTKTARVIVSVQAAVSATNAGSMRTDMTKAVNDIAKADWRLTSFDRSQDSTGLERWAASFEARLPENQLNGLSDTTKKLSKAGMQLMINSIDFTPTLEEREAAQAAVRTQIYKSANDQLAMLNSALPGRGYRIALINFTNDDNVMPMMKPAMAPRAMMLAASSSDAAASPSMERAEKVTLNARVVYAANPPAVAMDKH